MATVDDNYAPVPTATGDSEPLTWTELGTSIYAKCDLEASLCDVCQDLLKILLTVPHTDERGGQTHLHHGTKERLELSATNCRVCNLIFHEVDYHDFTSYRIKTYPSHPTLLWIEVPARILELFLKLWAVDGSIYPWNNRVILRHPVDDQRGPILVPESYPSTSETIETALDWLNSCKNTHETCARMRVSTPLPKRVLDISESQYNVVRLFESSGQVAAYATLSYCWGSGVTLKTTQATLAEHTQKIPLEAFPTTLRESILLASKLGFHYMWIDALCIVQDDALDWAQQSKQMASIYQGCALNIAIAAAENSDSGTVPRLEDCSVYIGSIPSTISTADNQQTPTDGKRSIYAIISSNPRFSGLFYADHCRLESRGWVFQETMVSVASLYITPTGIEWQCCTNRCLPGKAPEDLKSLRSPVQVLQPKGAWARHHGVHPLKPGEWKRSEVRIEHSRESEVRIEHSRDSEVRIEHSRATGIRIKTLRRPSGMPSKQPREYEERIEQHRELYVWATKVSQRRLTKFEDKLPCIAGVVSKSRAAEFTYLAGLWKEDLASGLTWEARQPGTLKRPNSSIPTWTWASVEGAIAYPWFFNPGSVYPYSELFHIDDPTITEAWVDEVHEGSLGEVRGGQISMTGTIWPATLAGSGSCTKIDSVFGKDLELMIDEGRDWGESFRCFVLFISQIYCPSKNMKSAGPYSFFLVLEETGLGEFQFYRIGVAIINSSTRYSEDFEKNPNKYWAAGIKQKVELV